MNRTYYRPQNTEHPATIIKHERKLGPLERWIEDSIEEYHGLEIVPTGSLILRARKADTIRADLIAAIKALGQAAIDISIEIHGPLPAEFHPAIEQAREAVKRATA